MRKTVQKLTRCLLLPCLATLLCVNGFVAAKQISSPKTEKTKMAKIENKKVWNVSRGRQRPGGLGS